MSKKENIDHILERWPFDPFAVNVRLLELSQRKVLQMRVDMGLLQLEIEGRPDGICPDGANSFYELLKQRAMKESGYVLNDEECIEVDREFVQFYHRRICWLQLKEFDKAVQDADHTLGLMDLCKAYSPDEQWTVSHEQYRPFVLYHRTQAAALARLEQDVDDAAEQAIEQVNIGLEQLRSLFEQYEAQEQFEEDELVQRLTEFRDSLREKYEVDQSLHEQLRVAIENEDYEVAAVIRDKIKANAAEEDAPDWEEQP